ncbi:MAG: prepilin-type N-terminal cleavage/methylation domain-containing protein [Thermoguttaceae bacterium]|nr:prepilin-type N-terminal cleavage/methylation domain-containing protein [Thermoguttaceae bacterium]
MKIPNARPGMTLMEIMMSVMILGLGLLGILSVIPFIEFHSARVVESDFTAAAGTNAFAVIQSNQWEKPATWQQYLDPAALTDNMVVDNFIFPRFFDIFGEHGVGAAGLPDWRIELGLENWDDGLYGPDVIEHVYPAWGYGRPDADGNLIRPGARAQDVCRGRDDLVVERDENSPARPQLLLDESGKTDAPEFTGAYSWAALMSPVASDPAQSYASFTFPGNNRIVDNGIPRAEVAMKVDVLVFRGRDALDDNDWITAPVTAVNGTGYLGGMISVTTPAPTEFEKSLGSSTHILLIGPSDSSATNPEAPFFSAWYKISNYSRDGSIFALTLSGPSLPACWLAGAVYDRSADVRAVLFRNLRGVFTRTIPISETE